MTLLEERPGAAAPEPAQSPTPGVLSWLVGTDHKVIGMAYMLTAFVFYLLGGLLAMVIRTELAEPGQQIVANDIYNEVFTMHGSIMLLLFAGPFAFGLANYLVPLQIGALDLAFPRLNLISFWLYLGGGIVMVSGFLTADGAADFGWTAYPPLADGVRSPGLGGDLWLAALVLTGTSAIFTGVNVIATVITMRAPGMTWFRMPIFTWNMVATSVLILISFPVVTAAGVTLLVDRHLGGHVFDPAAGGSAVLYQHLFWFFGHPEVYILALPYFGVVTEVFATFSRRPVFGYVGLVLATLAICALSIGVWAHHMFATGEVLLPFFGATTMLIAVPTGVKFFNWIGTLWGGKLRYEPALLFAISFLIVFVVGGVSGVMLASPGIDFHVTDSYFVVAHFHYVLFGGSVFALFAGIYFWFPKFTGRILGRKLGYVHVALTFVGFNLTFFVQHILGLEGMPRRVSDYLEGDGWTTMNQISTVGAFLLGISTLPFLYNVWVSWRKPIQPEAADPWDGQSLEWATTSPPPAHNFIDPLPPIRSERPVWDARVAAVSRQHGEVGEGAETATPEGPTDAGRIDIDSRGNVEASGDDVDTGPDDEGKGS
ncbi:MAG: cytochrome c oxidase subunit I [Actinomycetota bacterium]|nr:cytochrome c oxidase subunit I [Actinomycetota bacterium]